MKSPTAAIACSAVSIGPPAPTDGDGEAVGEGNGEREGEGEGEGVGASVGEGAGGVAVGDDGADGAAETGALDGATAGFAPQAATAMASRDNARMRIPRARGPLPQERAAGTPGREVREMDDEKTLTASAMWRGERVLVMASQT